MSGYSEIEPLLVERLFEPFLDPVDGSLCVPAQTSLGEIHARASAEGLRFPLALDPNASLAQHLDAALHAPACHRFGPYCDNVMGMNWCLPDGTILRIGERVAKTTTGYDWLRFLLHSGKRFGEATHYVIRLRPDCGFSAVAHIEGDAGRLRACVTALLRGAWMHWWDSIDYLPREDGGTVRVGVHCPRRESAAFETELRRVAGEQGLQMHWQPDEPAPWPGLPDFALKTTPDRVLQLAADVARRGATDVVAFCYHGVVHGRVGREGVVDTVQALVRSVEAGLTELGGEWHSRHGVPRVSAEPEQRWMAVLGPVLRGRSG